MKKITFCSIFLLTFFVLLSVNIHSQQCKVITKNIIFESSNSLTFDVYLQNDGASSWVYSHGSLAWNYDPAFLNGGTPTFTLVPGYGSFPATANPPSALITSSNILRTSSNLPGSNGVIAAEQSLRLQRFRLQTSAASFSGTYFNLSWKNSVVPYTRIYSWDSGTGLPVEVGTIEYSTLQSLFVEDFDYGITNDPDLLAVTTNWTRHSGTTGPAYINSSLTYTSYPSSGIGGSTTIAGGSSGDINRAFPTSISTDNNVYVAFLANLSSASSSADYFFHLGPDPIGTTFRARVFSRSNGTGWSLGLSKSTEARVDDNTILNFNQTYIVVLKYALSTATTTDDVVTLYVYETGIPISEPGSPMITIGPIGAGLTGDINVGSVAIRQGSNSPTGVIDGIRAATTWSEIFSTPSGPTLVATPQALSNFSYLVGSGPSVSQSYSLTGSELSPASGSILVTGTTNYEVSTNNTTFTTSVNIPYTGAVLSSTVYVRLKAGLPSGFYNNEAVSNAGGGATTVNVTCSGVVQKPEPTNHVTAFTGVQGIPAYYLINLNWVDAAGATVPDGYIIKGSDVDYTSIIDPVDGTAETNSYLVQNITQGIQNSSFGLNSGTIYYFKIYPYTNSGSAINYKTDGSIPEFTIATAVTPSLPITENFNYATGSFLTDNGWVSHSGAGTNPIIVNATPLTYTGYVNSGIGKSVTLTTSGEDDNRAFGSVISNSVYASFMVNITSAQLPGDYIFNFAPENSSFYYYCRTFVKKNAGDSLAFGIAKNVSGSVVYTPFDYSLNTTYLVVVNYTFNSGTTSDDEVKLWINPVLNGTEPTADVTQTDAGTDALSLGMFALRQGSTSNAATLTLGGIRVADTWIPGSAPTTFQLSVSVTDGWNMVSVPGVNPDGQGVDFWWSGRNPLADVYKWNGTYASVTTATPTEGYWMLHTGANTYNTGDEWPAGGIQIVAHDPIAITTGWNMIGGYENSPLVSGLTTTPAGLIVPGTVYGWSGSYSSPTNLVPGFGYWLLSTGSGVINPPTLLAGGSSKLVAQEDKSEWGKITLTDASGKSYTLYSVDGEVNLDQYQMPPLPPAGMFDVRYSSNRKAEDLKESNQTIEMRGLEYPVTVRVEKMSIKLQDETGKLLSERLKAGEEVIISNSAISKLMVSSDLIPDEYALEQNYPNPFNPSTKIEFSIPEDVNNVTLTIYNALGQRVAELVNSKMEAGKYSYLWNASSVATGMYIYELRTDKFVSVKKMMLLK